MYLAYVTSASLRSLRRMLLDLNSISVDHFGNNPPAAAQSKFFVIVFSAAYEEMSYWCCGISNLQYILAADSSQFPAHTALFDEIAAVSAEDLLSSRLSAEC